MLTLHSPKQTFHKANWCVKPLYLEPLYVLFFVLQLIKPAFNTQSKKHYYMFLFYELELELAVRGSIKIRF